MKLLLVAVACALVSAQAAEQVYYYPDKYDNIDIDAILANRRLTHQYVKCLLQDDDAGCSEDAKILKSVVGEALSSECSKCTSKQREHLGRVVRVLVKSYPQEWRKLKAKYDPDGAYTRKYQKYADQLHLGNI